MWKVTAHNIQLCPCCLDIKPLGVDSKVAKLTWVVSSKRETLFQLKYQCSIVSVNYRDFQDRVIIQKGYQIPPYPSDQS